MYQKIALSDGTEQEIMVVTPNDYKEMQKGDTFKNMPVRVCDSTIFLFRKDMDNGEPVLKPFEVRRVNENLQVWDSGNKFEVKMSSLAYPYLFQALRVDGDEWSPREGSFIQDFFCKKEELFAPLPDIFARFFRFKAFGDLPEAQAYLKREGLPQVFIPATGANKILMGVMNFAMPWSDLGLIDLHNPDSPHISGLKGHTYRHAQDSEGPYSLLPLGKGFFWATTHCRPTIPRYEGFSLLKSDLRWITAKKLLEEYNARYLSPDSLVSVDFPARSLVNMLSLPWLDGLSSNSGVISDTMLWTFLGINEVGVSIKSILVFKVTNETVSFSKFINPLPYVMNQYFPAYLLHKDFPLPLFIGSFEADSLGYPGHIFPSFDDF